MQGRKAHYGALAGPICGARTGFAVPKKITTPCPPHRVESASSGTSRQLSISCQLIPDPNVPCRADGYIGLHL
jgi:hypothetical protein